MRDDIDLQLEFVNSMLTQTVSDSFVDVSDMDARLEVYRRNFMQGHCNALQKTFTVTAQYLGDVFTSLAVAYVCQYRPKAGQLLSTYGESFPLFLQDPIATELARLEWDLKSVAIAAVDEGQECVEPDQVYWQLRSDVRLFQSDYNVREVYRTLKIKGAIGRIEMKQFYYLVWCKDEVPIIQSISQEEYRVFDFLRSPSLLGEIFDNLTFSKEIFVKVFNINFLKVLDVNAIHHSEKCSIV
ncbi:HvfC/BufC N-terminal domain-containing protein [Candidatus Bodocaedibacter vickermanii]|uniref:DUF2063 domain-containing protein n=1 Tax=Candidatus Bodocaedibacter vickermanii TaxID=2741701 RepID=A0A7L9RSV7_9PROT|nr:DUF2063 domain-containing protein [Candidatus Paracaedibacteraceae bacterium 'Lake Konstanz']